jgi:endonuclease YncB( thermonuclease family)
MDTQQEVQRHSTRTLQMLAKSGNRAAGETLRGASLAGRPTWQAGTEYTAQCVRAVDGDTIIVAWLGAEAIRACPDRIRLAGIDAPELLPHPEPGAESARLHLQRLCGTGLLYIHPTRAWPDRYARLIARVYDANRQDLCHAMVRDGYAVQYRNQKQRKARQNANNPTGR